ncbi:MAG: D-alanyl-D-alanine carboxypeptidase family protein [Spiribacter sp.]|jgi:D-alanyl-D-alanine carboxypeptidase (penicillin-binding protein 5/6)|nr:D-alanyl-D-alanine carboxypeptidase family protein [Spiribacter sp.]MDR9489529.1 D-alanyl-D-alanine carboxypeptidase family protein [Spiribacter sp.]
MPPIRLIALFIILLWGYGAQAQTQPIPVPSPPSLGAESYLLMDFHSGQILAEKQSEIRRDPASLTKVMTAFVVFSELKAGNLALDDTVRVSEKAWRSVGSRMFIEVGNQVSVENLLRGMIIQSGNDASVALAEHIAGNEETFAILMNQYADELGMRNTHYTNAAGLPNDNHYSSAADTARLVRALIGRFPDFYRLYSERAFTWNGIEQLNRNRMLFRDDSVDGVKTGYTEAAGYCLATSAVRDGMRLISVVMGTDSQDARVSQSQTLLNYGYRFFETHRLYAAGERIEQPRVWRGEVDQVDVGVQDDVHITIPVRTYEHLNAQLKIDELIEAPLSRGETLGTLTVTQQEKTLLERDVVALDDVPEAGIVGRMVDSLLLWIN